MNYNRNTSEQGNAAAIVAILLVILVVIILASTSLYSTARQGWEAAESLIG